MKSTFRKTQAMATRDQCAETLEAVGRRDLILALFGFCTGALACASGAHGEVRSNSGPLGDWLRYCGAGFFADLTALRRLGAIYLVAHPEERSCALLSHLLIGGDDGTIPSRLLRAIARDWSSNHVAVVDGWLLARAEARLCAVLYLEEAARA
jgi:hypothetical protein